MWYRLALTEIEPTGQLNFPDMGRGKLDFNDLSYQLTNLGKKPVDGYGKLESYRISVHALGSKSKIGYLDFSYDDLGNNIIILLIKVKDIKQTIETYEDSVMTNTGRGISTKLYEKLLEYIKSDPKLSSANHIISNVHSLQTYKAQNRVFGKPEHIGEHLEYEKAFRNLILQEKSLKQYQEYEEKMPGRFKDNIIETQQAINIIKNYLNSIKLSEEEALKDLMPSYEGELGSLLGGGAFDTIHKIPQDDEAPEDIKKDPNQMELFENVV